MAASGSRSLKFTDAAGLAQVYNPHMHYSPHMREGVATAGFDLRIEEGADIALGWRDAARPFRTGPSLRIIGGELKTGDQTLMALVVGLQCHALWHYYTVPSKTEWKAAVATFSGLFKPGMLSIVTDAAGVFIVMLVPIPLMEKLALMGGFWVMSIIVPSMTVGPPLVSFTRLMLASTQTG